MSIRGVLSAVLGFEVIVAWLFIPVAITVSGVSAAVAVPAGIALGIACVVAIALLRKPYGVLIGSVLQGVAVLLGFVVPTMFVVGGIFALLWFASLRMGRRVEEIRRERGAADGAG